jgi:hypothetical protein
LFAPVLSNCVVSLGFDTVNRDSATVNYGAVVVAVVESIGVLVSADTGFISGSGVICVLIVACYYLHWILCDDGVGHCLCCYRV